MALRHIDAAAYAEQATPARRSIPDEEGSAVMITGTSKSVIPFRPQDAKRVGEGCYYLDFIVWLNADRIEMGDGVGFNYGCYVNGYGGLVIGDRLDVRPVRDGPHCQSRDGGRPAARRAGVGRGRPCHDRR